MIYGSSLVTGSSSKKINSNSIANAYSSSASYSVGDMITHGGVLYECNTAIPSGGEAWDISHWTVVIMSSQISSKMNVPSKVSTGSTITLVDNTEYRLTNVTSLTLTYPSGYFDVWICLTTASSGTVTITFPNTTKYIGSAPTFGNNETWEISIKDGIAVAGKAELAT